MGTHNICFHGEIRKIFTKYPFLSRLLYTFDEDLDQLAYPHSLIRFFALCLKAPCIFGYTYSECAG